MANRWIHLALCAGLSGLVAVGCSDPDDAGGSKKDDALYRRLGSAAGVETVVNDFVGRVVADPKINGYFLNSSLDAARLSSCLVKQIGEATGGPEKYDCRSMKESHAGLGISKQDFDDLVAHLTGALVEAQVAQADIDAILGVLGPMAADIVEDTDGTRTIYQRVGRKPAIQTVIGLFHAKVSADTRINSFFADTNADRLATCLVRQVCQATGGPCRYGEEIPDAEPGVKTACRDMKASHVDMGVSKADFDALVEDLVEVLTEAGVTEADRAAIGSALVPMCSDVVEVDPEACG